MNYILFLTWFRMLICLLRVSNIDLTRVYCWLLELILHTMYFQRLGYLLFHICIKQSTLLKSIVVGSLMLSIVGLEVTLYIFLNLCLERDILK